MLSAMYTYCPPGPQPPKTGTVPYQYIGDPLPQSPTLSPYLYARPPFPGNPFSTPPSVAQGLIPHPTATVALSHDAATALISLGREQVGHIGESASPDANGKALSPIKLEQMSPESAATPPISVTIEADSSTTSNEQSYKSTQNPSMTIEVSEPQDTSNPSYPTIPNMFTDTTRISCPPREFEATYPHVQSSALQIPYTHSPTFTQPAQSSYTTIRYPPTASAMPQIGPISYFPQLPSRTDAIFPRNNSCHLCGKTYARLSTLKTHLRSHSGEKPYQCSICQKSFTQAANLTAHLRTHSGEKPFKCPICNRGFSQSSSVTTHMRTHSGDRPYKCTVCNKGFADSSTLTKHFRTHTGEKPYQCKICDARFSQSGNLNRHMRTHRNHFPVLGHIQQ